MHREAFQFVGNFATHGAIRVIEIGSRDINGTCRPLFPNAKYIGLDLYAGTAVDWVGDAVDYKPSELVDVCLIIEVLEHAANWRELIRVAETWLANDGRLIVTCAGPGRPEHSAIDGGPLQGGEYYHNLTALEVANEMRSAGIGWIESDEVGQDVQVIGWRIARD